MAELAAYGMAKTSAATKELVASDSIPKPSPKPNPKPNPNPNPKSDPNPKP